MSVSRRKKTVVVAAAATMSSTQDPESPLADLTPEQRRQMALLRPLARRSEEEEEDEETLRRQMPTARDRRGRIKYLLKTCLTLAGPSIACLGMAFYFLGSNTKVTDYILDSVLNGTKPFPVCQPCSCSP